MRDQSVTQQSYLKRHAEKGQKERAATGDTRRQIFFRQSEIEESDERRGGNESHHPTSEISDQTRACGTRSETPPGQSHTIDKSRTQNRISMACFLAR